MESRGLAEASRGRYHLQVAHRGYNIDHPMRGGRQRSSQERTTSAPLRGLRQLRRVCQTFG